MGIFGKFKWIKDKFKSKISQFEDDNKAILGETKLQDLLASAKIYLSHSIKIFFHILRILKLYFRKEKYVVCICRTISKILLYKLQEVQYCIKNLLYNQWKYVL